MIRVLFTWVGILTYFHILRFCLKGFEVPSSSSSSSSGSDSSDDDSDNEEGGEKDISEAEVLGILEEGVLILN